MTVFRAPALDKNAPIVDSAGRPSPYLQRFWQNLSFQAETGANQATDVSQLQADMLTTVRLTGAQTITGLKTFTVGIRIASGGPTWTSGTGSPLGVVTAPVGSLFSRTDGGAGTSLYVKESGTGAAGWVAK